MYTVTEIIEILESEGAETIQAQIDALEDGEALFSIGFRASDQLSIECAHGCLSDQLKAISRSAE